MRIRFRGSCTRHDGADPDQVHLSWLPTAMWKDKGSTDSRKPLIALDLFETLLDTASISRALEDQGVQDAKGVAALWRRYQLEYTWRLECMGAYLDFEEVTRRSLAQAAPGLSDEKRATVMEAYAHLETFADVSSGLKQLMNKGNADLVIFTNGTRAMVEGAVKGSPSLSPFAKDLLPAVVVDDPGLRHYKPSPAAYNFVASTYTREASNGNMWLVSSNPFDVAGARSAGWNAVWVDRAGAGWTDGLGTPTKIVRDFGELEAALGLE